MTVELGVRADDCPREAQRFDVRLGIDERASEFAAGDRRLGEDDAVGGGSSVGGHSTSKFQNVDRHLLNDRIRRRQIVLSSNLYKLFVGTNERDLSIGRFQLECCSELERIKRP